MMDSPRYLRWAPLLGALSMKRPSALLGHRKWGSENGYSRMANH